MTTNSASICFSPLAVPVAFGNYAKYQPVTCDTPCQPPAAVAMAVPSCAPKQYSCTPRQCGAGMSWVSAPVPPSINIADPVAMMGLNNSAGLSIPVRTAYGERIYGYGLPVPSKRFFFAGV